MFTRKSSALKGCSVLALQLCHSDDDEHVLPSSENNDGVVSQKKMSISDYVIDVLLLIGGPVRLKLLTYSLRIMQVYLGCFSHLRLITEPRSSREKDGCTE